MYNYSIIIPHYDIPDLLIRCLKSIPKRDDVQVIVIDDGSPYADKYLMNYPELSAPGVEFHSVEHQGLAGEMRNIGLQFATGKWVLFVDADDFLSDKADALFTQYLENDGWGGVDIIFHLCSSVESSDISIPASRAIRYNLYYSDYVCSGDPNLYKHYFPTLWGKIYNRDFIESNKIRFDKTKYSNDAFFSLVSGHLARTIKVVGEVLYVATSRESSLASDIYLNKVPSLEECSIRMNIYIRVYVYMCKNKIKLIDKFDRRVTFLSFMRRHYKLNYYKFMFYLLFIDPYLVYRFIKIDAKYIYRKLFVNTQVFQP